MTLDKDNLLESIMASLDRINNIKSSDLPNIDLYMDQVTTFMQNKLKNSSRNPEEDKILTKTMINNYAKDDLLPPPVKKKYTREHMVMLIFIYYSKGLLSISDIRTMLGPLTDRYFDSKGNIDLCTIYDEVFSMEEEKTREIKQDITAKYERSKLTFTECEGEDKEILQLFSFIFMLGFDVYTKKLLIEKLLDIYGDASSKDEKKEEKSKKGRDRS
ncbi:MAG: DUF1836 domain-containing protein [Lachnospiraceae bacterium]|nr:DUF1836 domain-containing protein [Lachnospiraceae bacterium]